MKSSVAETFSSYRWHDAELVSLHVVPGTDRSSRLIELAVLFEEPSGKRLRTVVFEDCRAVGMTLDMFGMELAGNTIAAAWCDEESSERDRMIKATADGFTLYADDGESCRECRYFVVKLISPGGDVRILAVSFHEKEPDAS